MLTIPTYEPGGARDGAAAVRQFDGQRACIRSPTIPDCRWRRRSPKPQSLPGRLRRERIPEADVHPGVRRTDLLAVSTRCASARFLSQRRDQARALQSADELAAVGTRADRSARPAHADASRRAVLVEPRRAARGRRGVAGAGRDRSGLPDEGEPHGDAASGHCGDGDRRVLLQHARRRGCRRCSGSTRRCPRRRRRGSSIR